ncbi:MAG: methyltransferase domain-containing protein [Actinobacteria bacterium]|nr:methyltransferase domain-containing protein [Actinomycetota bacterium]MBV8563466.1 methyltransferase domain-containing protein [Actinomycetota bacterium]
MEPTDHNRRAWEEAHRHRQEPVTLPPIVGRTLGDLTEKRVLHLQSATGEATAALAELGAVATGVDPRLELVDAARERWPSILWVQGEPQQLPAELRRGRFDLVYSGEGVIGRLGSLDGWARGIAAALRPRGELLVFDDHPVAYVVDGMLRWRETYFQEGLWRLGQIVSALASAGMQIEALQEYPGGTSRLRHDKRVPSTFLLYARREG